MLERTLGYQIGKTITQGVMFPLGKKAMGGLATGTFAMGRAGFNTVRQANWQGGWQTVQAQGKYVWGNRREIAGRMRRGSKAAYGATLGRDVKFYRGMGGKFLKRATGPLLSAGFIGYEISQGKNAAEGIMKGGVEAGALAAGATGAAIGAGALSFIPGVGTLIGGFIGFGLGYSGVHKLLDPGFTTRATPEFENVYMNRRALTMRQASMMELAKTSRSAFGNEASMMHLR
jgi:hypothetical protein